MVFIDQSGGVHGQNCSTEHNDAGLMPARVPQFGPAKTYRRGERWYGVGLEYRTQIESSRVEQVGNRIENNTDKDAGSSDQLKYFKNGRDAN